MSKNAGKTVAEILQDKIGRIKHAPLDPGTPGWDELLDLTWEQVEDKARKRVPGFQTIYKLLTDRKYDK